MTPSATHVALANVVVDIERAASRAGWDHAPSLYALVPTKELLESGTFPPEISEQLRVGWDGSAHHLSAIIQEDFQAEDLEDVLGHLAWPEQVHGAALTIERVVVPPHVEDAAPADPDEALAFVQNHPERSEVRLAVGALRTGETWCAVRSRNHDSDDKVGQGSQIVPSLAEALLASLQPDA